MWNLVIVIQSPKYVVLGHQLGHKYRGNTRGSIMPPSESKTIVKKNNAVLATSLLESFPKQPKFQLLKGFPLMSFKGKLSLCGDTLSIDATTKHFE